MLSCVLVRNAVVAFAGCVALLSPAIASEPGGVSTPLTLINGWQNGPSGTANASVYAINGIVHFKGAISTTGGNDEPFILPAQFRPAERVYVPIDACKATNARLDILPSGDTHVETEGSFSKSSCLVSLDGASFSLSNSGFKPLKLVHGWNGYGQAYAPATRTVDSMVTFQGAMYTFKNNDVPFTMPKADWPAGTVYVKVDLCDAKNGRFEIDTDGTVYVEVENKFTAAKCFTSLDGVSYALNGNGFTNLDLINGWENYFSSGRTASVNLVNGIVHFQGAIDTGGTNPKPFVLPAGFRPSNPVYLPVDMCDATNGRLVIKPDGTTTVEAEKDFSSAQCFTSLEGVSFQK